MKKIVLCFTVIMVFLSCNKDKDNNNNDKVRLLEAIIESNGRHTQFEYDQRNRITKFSVYQNENFIHSQTFTYSGNDLVKVVLDDNTILEFTKEGNIITVKDSSLIIYLNNDGTLAKLEETYSDEWGSHSQSINFLYNGGNMTNLTTSEGDVFADYQYDNEKPLFHHCKTPKWYLMLFSDYLFGNRNNATLLNYHWGITINYQYEYDEDGFPVKCIESRERQDESPTTTNIEYKYKAIIE